MSSDTIIDLEIPLFHMPSVPVSRLVKKGEKLITTRAIIWGNAHGPGKWYGSWSQNNLKICGVYSTKAKAEEAKAEIMSGYENCGYGDILTGDSWEDEICLVIRMVECHE